jgi:hypothetical protein
VIFFSVQWFEVGLVDIAGIVKRTNTSHLKSWNTKKITIYGLGHAQKGGWIKKTNMP